MRHRGMKKPVGRIMDRERLWTRDFIILSGINFLIFLTHFILMVTMAAYAVDRFSASTKMAGLATGVFILGALIGRAGVGRIIEDIGSKKLLTFSTVFFVVTSGLYFFAADLPLLILIRFFHGVTFGMAGTATGTIVAQIIPGSRRGEGIGYYSMGAIVAVAIGPFAGLFLMESGHYRMLFLFTTLLAACGFAFSFGVRAPLLSKTQINPLAARKGFHMANYLEFKAVPVSLVTLVIGFCYSGVLTFVSLYTKQNQLSDAAGFFFLVYAGTVFVSRPFSGRLFDLKGANFVVYPCLFLFAAGMLLFSLSDSAWKLLAAGAVMGLGYGNFISCANAIALKGLPPSRLGMATSTFFIFVDFGFGVGPYVLGALAPLLGYRGLFLMLSCVILATVPLYSSLYGKKAIS
jgi:MFS family permease